MIAGIIIKEIEHRVADRGFGLQTGCVLRGFSWGEADDDGLPAYSESRATEQTEKGCVGEKFLIGRLRAA